MYVRIEIEVIIFSLFDIYFSESENIPNDQINYICISIDMKELNMENKRKIIRTKNDRC